METSVLTGAVFFLLGALARPLFVLPPNLNPHDFARDNPHTFIGWLYRKLWYPVLRRAFPGSFDDAATEPDIRDTDIPQSPFAGRDTICKDVRVIRFGRLQFPRVLRSVLSGSVISALFVPSVIEVVVGELFLPDFRESVFFVAVGAA